MSQPYYPAGQDSPVTTTWNERTCSRLEEIFIQHQRQLEEDGHRDLLPLRYSDIESVYRYSALSESKPERTFEPLTEKKLWASPIAVFNDTMEGAFFNDDSHAGAAATMYLNSPFCGCICFSCDAVHPLMWAHYSHNHEGYCVKYQRRDSALLLGEAFRPVRYRREPRRICSMSPDQMTKTVRQLFWTKSEIWEYEQEWRLQYPRINAYTCSGLLVPLAVIFGLRTPDTVKRMFYKETRRIDVWADSRINSSLQVRGSMD